MSVGEEVISLEAPLQPEEQLDIVRLEGEPSSLWRKSPFTGFPLLIAFVHKYLFSKHLLNSFWKKVLSLGIFLFLFIWLAKLVSLARHPLLLISFLYKRLPISLLLGFSYSILNEISSPATRVFFPHSEGTHVFFLRRKKGAEKICLKMWRECNNELYYTEDMILCTNYLLEGLEFNRCFARDVYLGIAPVEKLTPGVIWCGGLIRQPEKKRLKADKPYVLVMKRLDEDWRLDHQLKQSGLGTKAGMEFLAREVAHMHAKLSKSSEDRGKSEYLLPKLTLNSKLFNQALNALNSGPEVEKFRWVITSMKQAYGRCVKYFDQRYKNGHVKRCHGDLKATNLWVRPPSKNHDRQILALDCVDFRPEFCHIDTLSDVAMLGIDIEMRLTSWIDTNEDTASGKKLARHFLRTYLREVSETSENVWPVLEYYLTEKAMICAYISILYDDLPTLGEKYLDVALTHAKRLEQKLDKLQAAAKSCPLQRSRHR